MKSFFADHGSSTKKNNMLVPVEDILVEAQIPEIWETEEEKNLSVRELKNLNFAWALRNLRGKSFANKSINEGISVSRDGLGEWKTVTKSRDQVVSIKILGQLLENAVFRSKKPHNPPDPNIKEVIYLQQDCKVNGTAYTAVITVKVYKSRNQHKYYHHYLDNSV
jgi:hypothetical protein